MKETPWLDRPSGIDAIGSKWYQLIAKLEELIQIKTVSFYKDKGIHFMMLPVTTGSISSPMGLGSDSLPVQIEIGGQKTYLADSMQFLLEYGCRLFDNGCYYIMPTFRGEEVDSRHLSQFFHSEAEIAGDLNDVMALVDEYVKHLSRAILKTYGGEIQSLIGRVDHIEKLVIDEIPRYTFDEVVEILSEHFPDKIEKYITDNGIFRNITNSGERAVMDIVDSPLWITRYDRMSVPFYQKNDEVDPQLAKNADLLLGIGETVGCGERNTTVKEVMESLAIHQVDQREYEWYIELREKYPLQTAGFGMGIERFLLFILNHKDIRDVQLIRRFNDGKDII